MNLTDWIIAVAGTVISLLIAVSAFFITRWIGNVDETLKKHGKSIGDLTLQSSTLAQAQSFATENYSKGIQTQLTEGKLSRAKIDEIKDEVSIIKEVTQKKILPQLERFDADLGKVTVLETNLNSLISGLRAKNQQKN